MKTALFICLSAAVVFAIAFAVLLALHIRQKKRIRSLNHSIRRFLDGGDAPELSLHDDRFAELENSVADLGENLLAERSIAHRSVRENNRFIADVSHQLKTPLAGMRLYCEMDIQDADDCPTPRQSKQLALIERMEKLIADLLHFEWLRSDGYQLDIHEEDLADLCRSVLLEMQPLIGNREIIVSGNAVLRCDKSRIREALGNVLKNACEHTDNNGKIRIQIEHGDHTILLTVIDNGGGLPVEVRENLFSRFYRAPNTTSGGTGLGLSIARAIAEKHHGTITADNLADGLRVTFCFPNVSDNLRNGYRE